MRALAIIVAFAAGSLALRVPWRGEAANTRLLVALLALGGVAVGTATALSQSCGPECKPDDPCVTLTTCTYSPWRIALGSLVALGALAGAMRWLGRHRR